MAAPTFVAAGTFQGGAADIVPGLPAGQQADDILLLFVETDNQAVTAPTGYTEVANSPQGSTGSRLTVFWKRSVGAGETAPTVTDPGNHAAGQLLAFRGCVTSGDPWDITAGSTTGGAANISVPGDTTTVADCLVVLAVSNGTDTATAQSSNWSNGLLTGIAELTGADNNTTAGNGGGFGVAAGVKATAGVFGNTTGDLATSSAQGRMMIALKPDTGAPAETYPAGHKRRIDLNTLLRM